MKLCPVRSAACRRSSVRRRQLPSRCARALPGRRARASPASPGSTGRSRRAPRSARSQRSTSGHCGCATIVSACAIGCAQRTGRVRAKGDQADALRSRCSLPPCATVTEACALSVRASSQQRMPSPAISAPTGSAQISSTAACRRALRRCAGHRPPAAVASESRKPIVASIASAGGRLRRGSRRARRASPPARPRSACRSREIARSPSTTTASVASARGAVRPRSSAVATQHVAAPEAAVASLSRRAVTVRGRAQVHADRVRGDASSASRRCAGAGPGRSPPCRRRSTRPGRRPAPRPSAGRRRRCRPGRPAAGARAGPGRRRGPAGAGSRRARRRRRGRRCRSVARPGCSISAATEPSRGSSASGATSSLEEVRLARRRRCSAARRSRRRPRRRRGCRPRRSRGCRAGAASATAGQSAAHAHRGVVGRAVVDQDHAVLERLGAQMAQAAVGQVVAVVGDDHDVDGWRHAPIVLAPRACLSAARPSHRPEPDLPRPRRDRRHGDRRARADPGAARGGAAGHALHRVRQPRGGRAPGPARGASCCRRVTVPVHARNRVQWVLGEQTLLPRAGGRARGSTSCTASRARRRCGAAFAAS